MALITSQSERVAIPHEEGQWVEIRPLRAGDLGLFTMAGDHIKVTYELLGALITAWSYGDLPANYEERIEQVKLLDLDTYIWLTEDLGKRLAQMSGIRSEEKKDSSSSSSLPRTGLAAVASPENSVT